MQAQVDYRSKNIAPPVVGEHLIGQFCGDEQGPTLIVFGGVHGNEAAGVKALRNVSEHLRPVEKSLKGRVYFLFGNTRALSEKIRFIDSDLNRHWTPANLAKATTGFNDEELSEDRELAEILPILERILGGARSEVFALDLHSTSADGVPFATVGDTLRNRAFAMNFPTTILLGIEEQLDGTILEYLNNRGAVTFGYEGGQHFSEKTVRTHEALVHLALTHSGIIGRTDEFAARENFLREVAGRPRIIEIRYRHAITPADDFRMDPGFDNFTPVTRGQRLAEQANGVVKASESGLLMMPLYQKLGEDGFFLGREIAPFWLKLSAILRRSGAAGWMRHLPGVKSSDESGETLEINTRIARFFPLQIFHLLGFRKRRRKGDLLVVSRRKHDTTSPFPLSKTK